MLKLLKKIKAMFERWMYNSDSMSAEWVRRRRMNEIMEKKRRGLL